MPSSPCSTRGERILPAVYSEDYVSLLPGKSKTITIRYPASAPAGAARLTLHGWNVASQDVAATH